ncbi:MAG TPA: EAL domain-containing protein [Anaerolineales bacterium]|nr:EAL domain-containing protein [Anaerolineales bacterium]
MAWEIIVQSPDTERTEYDIKPGKTTVGRMSGHDIVIADEAASRNHAVLELDDDDQLVIWDAGSTNGTFVNGREITGPQVLNHNDQVRIGLHILTAVVKDEARPAARWAVPAEPPGDYENLLIRSLDHYTVLLHNLSIQLSRVQSIAEAQRRISVFLGQMLNAERCGVVLQDDFGDLPDLLGSPELVEYILRMKAPLLLQGEQADTGLRPEIGSLVLSPVLIDQDTAALIYAIKEAPASRCFDDLDRLLVVGVSHHAAMAIQRLKYEQALLHSANYDTLTGLPNRKLFLERLSHSIARVKRHPDYGFAVFFIDANNFKLVNDSLGHQLGDDVLREIGSRLQGIFRELDTVARFGGDEFAVLVDGVREVQEVLPLAQRVIASTSEPYSIKGHEFVILLSMGITLSSTGYEFAEDAMRDADIAMYKSKETGGASFRVYDRLMHEQLMNSLKLQTDLRNAYKMEEFLLQYQPIVALDTGEVEGFEALLRWNSHDRGLVRPDQFFSSIDTAGLLNALERWVLHTACQQLAYWNRQCRQAAPLFMSVNLSAKQLENPNLLDMVEEALLDTGIKNDELWLEISEKNSIDVEGLAIQRLRSLRNMGVHLSLDDFGTGYSTLGYLSRLPIDVLKIDRSFVSQVDNAESIKIIHTIMGLARNLSLSVVAEGVETRAQMNVVRQAKCQYAQGYYFARPLDAGKVPEFLEKHPAFLKAAAG